MSRPKPQIIMDWTHPKTYKSEQILKSTGIYAVFYNGAPINFRTIDSLQDTPGPRYKKTSFPNPGHAFNLAEKLNTMFKTNKFEVFKLTSGVKLEEGEE